MQIEKARSNHCKPDIVIKLSTNSFFSEFRNIFEIGHGKKVRKKTSVIGKTLQRNSSL